MVNAANIAMVNAEVSTFHSIFLSSFTPMNEGHIWRLEQNGELCNPFLKFFFGCAGQAHHPYAVPVY